MVFRLNKKGRSINLFSTILKEPGAYQCVSSYVLPWIFSRWIWKNWKMDEKWITQYNTYTFDLQSWAIKVFISEMLSMKYFIYKLLLILVHNCTYIPMPYTYMYIIPIVRMNFNFRYILGKCSIRSLYLDSIEYSILDYQASFDTGRYIDYW